MNQIDVLKRNLISDGKNYVQGSRLIDRLCKQTKQSRYVVITGLKVLRDSGEIVCTAWYRGEPVGRVQLFIKSLKFEACLRWEKVLDENLIEESDRASLMRFSDMLDDWESVDMDRLLKGLIVLRGGLPSLKGMWSVRVTCSVAQSS